MGNYDDIGLPVKGQPISSGAFGQKVRNYLINADARLSAIEGSLLPRYYIKSNPTARASTVTPAADSGGAVPLAGVPLEIGSYEIEMVGLFNLTTTGLQGLRTVWAFSGTWDGASNVRNCIGPGDSASAPNNNATLMAQTFGVSNQNALYFVAASSAWVSFREIAAGIHVTAPGSLSFNWSQAVTSANNTTLQSGSYFRITRYA
jgi:hypothetical protein